MQVLAVRAVAGRDVCPSDDERYRQLWECVRHSERVRCRAMSTYFTVPAAGPLCARGPQGPEGYEGVLVLTRGFAGPENGGDSQSATGIEGVGVLE